MSEGQFRPPDLRAMFQPFAAAIRAVMEVEEGSGGRKAVGSVTVIADENVRYLLTAAHTVSGPQTKLIGVEGGDALPWPRHYSRLAPVSAELPDADIACATATVSAKDTALAESVPLGLSLGGVPDYPGSVYLAVGFPTSKSKMRYSERALASRMMCAVVEIAPKRVGQDLRLDPRVQLAFTYSQAGRQDLDGRTTVGAHPRGMSGGAVFAMLRATASDGSSADMPYLVGILTDFHADQGCLVATRVSQVWRAIGLLQDGQDALYRRADV